MVSKGDDPFARRATWFEPSFILSELFEHAEAVVKGPYEPFERPDDFLFAGLVALWTDCRALLRSPRRLPFAVYETWERFKSQITKSRGIPQPFRETLPPISVRTLPVAIA
jgi:hypothetical protein